MVSVNLETIAHSLALRLKKKRNKRTNASNTNSNIIHAGLKLLEKEEARLLKIGAV